MHSVIDLTPYLPVRNRVAPPARERKPSAGLRTAATALEALVTLLIGGGFLLMLLGFLGALLF